MTDVSHAVAAPKARRTRELWEFKALVALTYPFFLVAVAAERALSPAGGPAAARRRSVFVEAHAAAAASLACAFMG